MRLRIQTPLARSENVSRLKRVISSSKAKYLAKRKKHLLKVVGGSLRNQRRSLLRRASKPKPKVQSNKVTQNKAWSMRKKMLVGTGFGGGAIAYGGYRATRPSYDEEYY